MIRTRPRTTYANIASTLALVVAVTGGGAAMAVSLADDSVGSATIRNGTVRAVDLRDGAVRGAKVLDGSLAGADVRDNSLKGADIDEDSLRIVPNADIAELAKEAEHAANADDSITTRRLLGLMRASVTAAGEAQESQSSGVVSAQQTSTPGRYVVTFGGPILGCFLMAGVAHNGTDRVVGSASAWTTPGQDPEIPNTNKVTVETHAPGGDAVPDPLPFKLLVHCDAS